VAVATAQKELLAPRDDVWAFVSQAGRLSDWWPGIFGAQETGDTWTIEGEERSGLSNVADRGGDERQEPVHVEKSAPGQLRLRFERSGYDVGLSLQASAPNRTTATLSVTVVDPHETAAERVEELVGIALHRPDNAFAESVLDRLYDACQTGADS